jgi:hypothetical protein
VEARSQDKRAAGSTHGREGIVAKPSIRAGMLGRQQRPAMANNNRLDQEPAEGSRETIDRALRQSEKGTNHGEGGKSTGLKGDAKGQGVRTKHGATNDGVSSADPRALSGKEDGDATWPLEQGKKS